MYWVMSGNHNPLLKKMGLSLKLKYFQ
jgi:hypothetical protein